MRPEYRFPLLAIFMGLLSSCLSHDNDVLHNPDPSREMSVDIYLANGQRTDTLLVGDSLTLFARILPSAINAREYGWRVNGIYRPMELILHYSWQHPGRHSVVFQALDRLGDTLRDTIEVRVRSFPTLGAPHTFFPATGSRGVPPSNPNGIHFQWDAQSQDPIVSLQHRFQLVDDSGNTVLDTLLSQNHLDFLTTLAPWRVYNWAVEAHDDLGSPAISAWMSFSTAGSEQEACLEGRVLELPGQLSGFAYRWGNAQALDSISISPQGRYRFCPLLPGDYTIAVAVPGKPDYAMDSVSVRAWPGVLTWVDTLYTRDRTPPTAELAIAQPRNAQILLRDLGSGVQWNQLRVWIDGERTDSWHQLDDSTLHITPTSPWPPGRHSLLLYVEDGLNNRDTLFLALQIYPNRAPTAPQILAPIWRSSARSDDSLHWSIAIDPDGDSVLYKIFLCLTADTCMQSVGTTAHPFLPLMDLDIPADTLVYWRVEAADSSGANSSSPSSTFEFLGSALLLGAPRRRRPRARSSSQAQFGIIVGLLLLLLGCGQDSLWKDEQDLRISTRLYVLPSYLLGTSYEALRPIHADTLLEDEEVELWGALRLGDRDLSSSEAENHAAVRWVIDGVGQNGLSIRRRFAGGRTYDAIFEVREALGDTLRDTLRLWVGRPLRFGPMRAPQRVRTDVNPWTGEPVHFAWTLHGVDPWEQLRTEIYLHPNLDSLWSEPVAVISGELSADVPLDLSRWVDTSRAGDSSWTLYYALVANTAGNGSAMTRYGQSDTSGIGLLRTTLRNATTSRLFGRLRAPWSLDPAGWQVQLHSVAQIYTTAPDSLGYFRFENLPPASYTLSGTHPGLPDLRQDTIAFLMPAAVHWSLDTLRVRDTRPPRVFPEAPGPWARSERIPFRLVEEGSGIDTLSLRMGFAPAGASNPVNLRWIPDGDFRYLLRVPTSGSDSAWVWLEATDLAGNLATHQRWLCRWDTDSIWLGPAALFTPEPE